MATYVDPIPPAPGTNLRPPSIDGWATAAKVTVGLTMATVALTIGTGAMLADAWQGWFDGTVDTGDLIDTETMHRNVVYLYLAFQVVTWGVVMTWMYKAAKNAERINPARMNNTPKWAVWGWVVPFMNWVRPYHMARETWEASLRGDTTETPDALFRGWWGLFLASGITFRYTGLVAGEDIRTLIYIEMFADVTYFAAGALFIKIIASTTERQRRAVLAPSGPPSGPPMPHYVLPEADQIIS